jgi:hypothetical protein
LIRFDNAQAAVFTVEPLFGNIILARGSKAPWDSKTLLSFPPSPATFPIAHAHCSATDKELFSAQSMQNQKQHVNYNNFKHD